MCKIDTPASNVGIDRGNPDLRILANDELDAVSGGGVSVFFVGGGIGQIVSPRDAASGLPTGK